MERRFQVLNNSIYYGMKFKALQVKECYVILSTFDGEKEFEMKDVKEVFKKEFYVLDNKTNKVKLIISAFEKDEVSKQYKYMKNIRIITKNKYMYEKSLIEKDNKKRETLLKKGINVRAFDIIK